MIGISLFNTSFIDYKNDFEILSKDYRSEVCKIKMESEESKKNLMTLDYPILRFSCTLQTLDEENNNGVTYETSLMIPAIQDLNKLVEWGGLTGEWDHPELKVNNDDLIIKRVSQIQNERSCVWFEKIWVDETSKKIKAVAQTLSSHFGNEFRNRLAQKVKIGFSMRGIVDHEDRNGKKFAIAPIKIVTYDVVTKPSHRPAVVEKIFMESTQFNFTKYQPSLTPSYAYESQYDFIQGMKDEAISRNVEKYIIEKYKIK
jgi:hypothetical protein